MFVSEKVEPELTSRCGNVLRIRSVSVLICTSVCGIFFLLLQNGCTQRNKFVLDSVRSMNQVVSVNKQASVANEKKQLTCLMKE